MMLSVLVGERQQNLLHSRLISAVDTHYRFPREANNTSGDSNSGNDIGFFFSVCFRTYYQYFMDFFVFDL